VDALAAHIEKKLSQKAAIKVRNAYGAELCDGEL
jgi:hypothetical protein